MPWQKACAVRAPPGSVQWLVLQDQLAKPALAARQHRFLPAVPGDELDRLDGVGEIFLDLGQRERGGQEDAGFALRAVEIGDGKEILGGQRLHLQEEGAAPVAEPVLPIAPRTALGDAVGIGQRQHPPGIRHASGAGRDAKLALPLPRLRRDLPDRPRRSWSPPRSASTRRRMSESRCSPGWPVRISRSPSRAASWQASAPQPRSRRAGPYGQGADACRARPCCRHAP